MNELIDAAKAGDAQEVKRLLSLNQTILEDELDTAFQLACMNGCLDVVNLLLDIDAPKVNYRKQNVSLESPIQLASANGHVEVVDRLLILDEPKIDNQNDLDRSFRSACANGHIGVVRRLLKMQNPRVNYKSNSYLTNATALYLASNCGHVEVVDCLLNLESPSIDDQYDLDRSFYIACLRGHVGVVMRFLATLDRNVNYDTTIDCKTAFTMACANGHIEVINCLLAPNGPTINFHVDDELPFRSACTHGHIEVVDRLLQLPTINPRAMNYAGLRNAMYYGFGEIVQSIAIWARNNGQRAQVEAIIREFNYPGHLINWGQSIHAGSVHKSASESAIRLKSRYGQILQDQTLTVVLGKLISFVGALDTNTRDGTLNFIRSAAKRYINEETLFKKANPKLDFDYKDSSHECKSNVSTKELLAYLYLASQDNSVFHEDGTQTSQEEKELNLVKGFYEAIRGYNINHEDIDNLATEDDTICVQGCFNKAVESMVGRHPDCKIALVTIRQAGVKFPKIVQEESIQFLINESTESKLILSELKASKNLEPVWPFIKAKVIERVMDEFGMVYHGDPQNIAFQSLMSVHTDICIAPIVAIVELRAFVDETVKSYLKEYPEDLERFKCEGVDKDIGLRSLWNRIENEFYTKFKPKLIQEYRGYFGLNNEKKAELDRIIQSAKSIVFSPFEMEQLTQGLAHKTSKPLLLSRLMSDPLLPASDINESVEQVSTKRAIKRKNRP